MISPISFSLPTRTMSYMRAPARPCAITAGPEIRGMTPLTPAMLPSSPEPFGSPVLRPPRPLLQLHGKPDVLFDQPGDVCFAGFEVRAGGRQGHHHRQIAPAQQPRPGLVRTLEQVFAHRQHTV